MLFSKFLSNSEFRILALLLLVSVFSLMPSNAQADSRKVYVGFFEGGDYFAHSLFRGAFRKHLDQIIPDSLEIIFDPAAFKTANWDKSSIDQLAIELKANKRLDLVVALGPWTAEGLLAAGFKRPILATLRFDPVAEGLVDESGRPIADNLNVISRQKEFLSGLTTLKHLRPVKKMGLLLFPSGNTIEEQARGITEAANRLGIEVFSAEGYNNVGTYAFFKAFQSLPKSLDAVYVSPLWAFDGDKIRQFTEMALRARTAVISSEGLFVVERGVLLSMGEQTIEQIARIAAQHTIEIISGTRPSSLPVSYSPIGGTVVNQGTAKSLGLAIPDDMYYGAHIIASIPSEEDVVLNLPEAVSLSLARSLGIQARYEIIAAAEAVASEVSAAYLPQLTADAYLGYIDDKAVENSEGRFDNMRFSGGVRLYQTLFSIRKYKSSRLAREGVKSEQVLLKQASLDLELAVNISYLELMEAREIVKEQRAYRLLIDRSIELSLTREIFDASHSLDLIRWQEERFDATNNVIYAETQAASALVLLNVLLSQPGHEDIFTDFKSYSMEKLVPLIGHLGFMLKGQKDRIIAEDNFVQLAIDFHPELESNRIERKLQQLRLSINRGRYWPEFGLRASFDFIDSLDANQGFSENHATWSIGASLELPLYLGGGRSHEKRSLQKNLSAMEYRRDQLSVTIMGKVRTSSAEFFSWIHRLPAIGQGSMLAEQYFDGLLPLYETGEVDIAEIILAMQSARNMKIKMLSSRYAFYLSAARLSHTIGISTEASGQSPAVELTERLQTILGNR